MSYSSLPNIVIAYVTSFVSCQGRFELPFLIFNKHTVIRPPAKNPRVARPLLLEQPIVRALRGINFVMTRAVGARNPNHFS
jgi:hypothetical protein